MNENDTSTFVEWVRLHSPFYRTLYGDLPSTEFDRLPIVEKELFVEKGILNGTVFTGRKQGIIGLNSGGSTGKPVLSSYTRTELEQVIDDLAEAYTRAGLERNDTVGNLFVTGYLYASFLLVNAALIKIGPSHYPLTHLPKPSEVANYIEVLGIDTIVGISANVIAVMDELIARGKPTSLRKVFYAGEVFPDNDQERYRNTLGLKTIRSGGYGAVDTGIMGFQCPYQSAGQHHLFDHCLLEIVDPILGKPLGDGCIGDVLISDLCRRFMPILRYRIGDRGKITDASCRCGRNGSIFEIVGRSGDYVECAGKRIYYDSLKTALNDLIEVFQLTKSSAEITINYEVSGNRQPPDQAFIRERCRTLGLSPIQLKAFPSGAIPRHPKTGKFLRVVERVP